MNYYLAPMEGITSFLYRKAYAETFGDIDKYFTPFLAPNQNLTFTHREEREFLPKEKQAGPLVPQILANKEDRFLWALHTLYEAGYEEINFNLGCSSRTVTSRGRGSAFLGESYRLREFFDHIFEDPLLAEGKVKLSVKTRLGVDSEEEFPWLVEFYRRYPLYELIVHARTQKDFYGGTPRYAAYGLAADKMECPVIYNGDIRSREDVERITKDYPKTAGIMIGRGILQNPGLMREIRGQEPPSPEKLMEFHERLYAMNREIMPGERNVLYKMKEVWCHWGESFPEKTKLLKKLRKTTRCAEYESLVREILLG